MEQSNGAIKRDGSNQTGREQSNGTGPIMGELDLSRYALYPVMPCRLDVRFAANNPPMQQIGGSGMLNFPRRWCAGSENGVGSHNGVQNQECDAAAGKITRRWSGPRRRYTSLAVERRACAAAAAQRHFVLWATTCTLPGGRNGPMTTGPRSPWRSGRRTLSPTPRSGRTRITDRRISSGARIRRSLGRCGGIVARSKPRTLTKRRPASWSRLPSD